MKQFLLLLLGLTGYILPAQTLVFEMKVIGKSFGKMTVTRTTEADGTEVYTLDASGKATVLWIDFVSHTRQESRYKNGQLVSSVYKEIENGKTKRWNKITYDGKAYKVESHKGQRSFTEAVTYSILSLYFHNHQNVKRIFYEAEGNFTAVSHPDANTVELKTSDGNRSVYHYVDGQLQTMEFHIFIATVYMRRIA